MGKSSLIPIYPKYSVFRTTAESDPYQSFKILSYVRKKHTDGLYYRILHVAYSNTEASAIDMLNEMAYKSVLFMKIIPKPELIGFGGFPAFELDEDQTSEYKRLFPWRPEDGAENTNEGQFNETSQEISPRVPEDRNGSRGL